MMDPKALFALMFSDFEHIVGDLATSTILATSGGSGEAADPSTDSGTDPGADPGADPGTTAGAGSGASAGANVEAMEARLKKKKEFQQMREAHLVKMLNRRLEPWLNHDENTFIEHAKHEVLALREEPFGRDLLKTVGYWYKKKASKMLDGKGALSGVTSFFDDLGDKAHSFKTQIRALEGGVKAMATTATAGENESVDETARREAVNTLGAVWLAAVVDIESTMRHVLDKILETDSKHAKKNPELKRKAEGVLILGKIFEQA